ncbi:hypothetical protein CCACVL1_18317 [Corchorus capsularis]|uniref:Uncharacterized protein n=1 Tax=Corchorus capsularis TaxID=210143 RepID=A0A1R3HLT7_COCAP|nr:hypothetical protein CCACVL1_18317 [Corchorus capsularis]
MGYTTEVSPPIFQIPSHSSQDSISSFAIASKIFHKLMSQLLDGRCWSLNYKLVKKNCGFE